MSDLRIIDIEKRYGAVQPKNDASFMLRPVRLSIREGEFFSLLGPSGCGKTTLLKLVAGLLEADGGEIWIGDKNLTNVPPESRQFAMVFQQSLLFPHKNIEDNVAFGLKMQKVGKKQRLKAARDMLEHVGLSGFGSRFPDELSGGQQQRVALARALVANPRVLLMDEPFSALDPGLREEMRELLSRIQKEFRVTVLFVTHDRDEAFALSDRIAIMGEGALRQVGNARELYERPDTTTVAAFLGLRNILSGALENGRFVSSDGFLEVDGISQLADGDYFMVIRPEAIKTAESDQSGHVRIQGIVQEMKYSRGMYSLKVRAGNQLLECLFTTAQAEKTTVGEAINLLVDMKEVRFLKE
ncbi:ABC transporter ATP-binding protein [Planococcus citreus]|uniref:Carnitine transport ATP-binding protein OpuCA n=1 Tax=Planococcus citreus TaxID=1373 RepID=A0A497YF72_9BACL|nr:ABC transporter ATP-binding protein [Planococcus citreus]RLJ86964.1 putative spermidine/putrescine transport system ATP-binding protein [Planococcus citreus]